MMTRKQHLEARMSALVGKPVDLTVRGARSFTFSTETVTADLGERIANFLGDLATVRIEHDEECGSFAYVEVSEAKGA
jgi:hypothetical protein